MSLIAYANSDYNSWIDLEDADAYFEARLYADEWTNATDETKEKALLQAFRELNGLKLLLDLEEDDSPLEQLKAAQCEQALHLLQNDPTAPGIASVSISGGISVTLSDDSNVVGMACSQIAIRILSAYFEVPTIKVQRK